MFSIKIKKMLKTLIDFVNVYLSKEKNTQIN